jgi:putative sugar O-methyltransferase
MDAALAQLLDELKTVPEVYRPSPFWQALAAEQVTQLEESGFENFKRTVNTRYFNWRVLGILRHQLWAIGRAWIRHPDVSVLRADLPQPRAAVDDRAASFDGLSAWIYKTYVAMYADVLAQQDTKGLLRQLDEPELGNPFMVLHRGRRISQDLCNSVHELYSLLGPAGSTPMPAPAFAELGAGYGRLGYVLMKAVPGASYTVIDIPPALYLSQRYLTALFPDARTFRYRPFADYGEIAREFEDAQLRFLAPHQAELLPAKTFD